MQPNFIDKIETIEGDIADIRLGISESNWKKLTEEVDVIFHMAAVVRFDAPLKSTVLSNVRGTREALRLGKSCRSLRSFVYVSTAYSHATRSRIGTEISDDFHESPASPDALIQLVENLDEDNLKEVTPA